MPASALPLHAASTIVLRGNQDFFRKDALRAQLARATMWNCVTVDFHDVDFVDASTLGCFARLYKEMCRISPHPRIRLVGLRPHLAALFRLTHLDSLFELIENDQTSAIRTGRPRPIAL
jgi:anti-anti-sigma factor